MNLLSRIRQAYDGMPHRHRQFLNLGVILAVGVGALWTVFTLGQPSNATVRHASKDAKPPPTNLGIQVAGEIDPREAWLGTAGRDVAQLKVDVEAQQRWDSERKNTEDALLKRLAELEQRTDNEIAQHVNTSPPSPSSPLSAPAPAGATNQPASYPPASPLSVTGPTANAQAAAGFPPQAMSTDTDTHIVRISLVNPAAKPEPVAKSADTSPSTDRKLTDKTVANFLPVSFTSGVLLGGIDAPTGGQAQSNPLPVLIRLTDNAVLPNRYRSEVKDCFIVAAAYGDISSERAYARTTNLSCVRHDGSALELPIQGNLYGEDGKLGIHGRLVTKQGQLLANALRAGIVGGIGQGFSQGGTSYTRSPFGTLATTENNTSEQIRRGMAGGVGRALDNLANYYIRLAEQTFPVVEVDAGRAVEVAITKGASIPAPSAQMARSDADEGASHEDD